MAKKIIEAVALLAGAAITLTTVVAIPLNSYNDYKVYLDEVKQSKAEEELLSITAELKEGVKYYANDIAEAREEHFIVTANYKKGNLSYSEPVEEGKFSVTTAADFYSVGGDVKISYRGVSTTIPVELIPVQLESINVSVTPYTIKYAAGSTFDDAGMIVNAVYNDGSSKVLSSDEYTVDTEKVLTTADKAVTVKYKEGQIEKTADVAIGVSATLDNGAVKSIVVVDGAIVNAGDTISNAIMEVNAVYESGNRVPLTSDQYTISGSTETLEFGKTYELTVSYNEDSTKTAETDVVVRQTIQGEDGVIVGGAKKTETEYQVVNGVITEMENTVTFAGNFSASVKSGKEGSLTLSLNSAAETVGDITMRCSNSYNVYANGSNANDGYMMKPLQINTILDLTVNGREVKVPTTVILKGCGPYETYAPLYGIYYEFTFEDVQLDAGLNNVKFNFKNSTVGAANCWGESPSTLNIDYVHFDTLGSEIPEEYTITEIQISDGFTLEYAQNIADVEVPVLATLDNGTKISLDPSFVDVEIVGGAAGDEFVKFGKYTVNVSLKSNPSVKASKEIEIEAFEKFAVLHAGVEVVDDKVYYVFSGESVGYTAEDLVFFDGATVYDIEATFTATEFTFKVDVTNVNAGAQIYPHLKVDGMNYDNGANSNGDIRGNGLAFTDGESVTFGGKSYTIKTAYSMPTLVVAQVSTPTPDPDVSYEANLDNAYVSDKTLVGEYVYGSEGVTTNGKDKNSEYTGGIGNMDKLDAYVTYTFNVTASGKADFVWNVAGSYYKNKTNVGIENMADHMTITIDGKSVDVGGIALPAGDGTNTSLWWNVQQVIVKDVELTAGEHTFSCTITTEGSGLNVGAMKIYFKADGAVEPEPHVHSVTVTNKVDADCENAGTKAYYTCTGCGKLFSDEGATVEIAAPVEIPAKGHDWTGEAIEGADGFYKECQNGCGATQDADTPVVDNYTAVLDNAYVSEKTNELVLVYGPYGAYGVETSGSHKVETDKGSPESGAIGGLDKAGQYVTYTFAMPEDGTVDIIWNIAGSNWNGSGNGGIADMANHMTVTLDGKAVNVGGIALPAGETYEWWNLQNVVVKNVVLTAGVHTFKCDVTAAGGLNVGSMTITSEKAVYTDKVVAKTADIAVEGGKVYYVLTFDNVGYTVADYEFFDGATIFTPALAVIENGVATFKFDVSDFAVDELNAKIYPHLRIAGKNYINGGNKNGDVFGEELVYEEGKSVTFNGKVYTITTKYSMPTLWVTAAVEEHVHSTVLVGKVDATCENVGTKAYYTCAGCDQIFSDEGATEVISKPVEIPAKGHNWSTEAIECEDGFCNECLNGCGKTQAAEAPVADSYTAALDNAYVSEKANELKLVFAPGGAYGIATSGSHKVEVDKGSPESGAIGGLDKAGQYVYYEFVMEKAGTVDFIWNIAGSNYNATTKVNDGIADMAKHMTVTIDGKAVNVGGIALPVGETYEWWNLQNVVVKDVVLEAGLHTFKCDVTAAGGLNVGSMTVKSSKITSVRKAVATSADVVVEEGKVYYVFTFEGNAYTADEIKFWHDTSTSYPVASCENKDGVTTVKVDVTELALGATINPHMSFGGVNYINDENKNGDVRGDQLVYAEKAVEANGKYYVIYTNYSMPALKIVENDMAIQGADLYEENGKVYYTLTYRIVGYDPATFEFFDGSTVYAVESYETNGLNVTFKINVTDYAAGTELWPHLRVNGQKWDGKNNTTSSNGDVKVSITGKTVTLNGKTYELKSQYSMPTVVVA